MFNPGPLPPASEQVLHLQAVADAALQFADEIATEAADQRLVAQRCAQWARDTAAEQLAAVSQ